MRTTVTDPITKAATSANRTSDQEFLGQMLGTRRSSVSVAASILQKGGDDYVHTRKRHNREQI